MNFREATADDLKAMGGNSISRGCFHQQPQTIDIVYALEHEGKLLGVGGLKMMNATTAWAWMDLTPDALHHKGFVFRLIREYIGALMEDHGIKRLMAAVECDFSEGLNVVEHLGFKQEGVMDKWSGDKDAFMYVRFGKE